MRRVCDQFISVIGVVISPSQGQGVTPCPAAGSGVREVGSAGFRGCSNSSSTSQPWELIIITSGQTEVTYIGVACLKLGCWSWYTCQFRKPIVLVLPVLPNVPLLTWQLLGCFSIASERGNIWLSRSNFSHVVTLSSVWVWCSLAKLRSVKVLAGDVVQPSCCSAQPLLLSSHHQCCLG